MESMASNYTPSFIVNNGLRKIIPYYHSNATFVKGRWLNRSVLDVLSDEFKTRDQAHYLSEILNGRIVIIRNNQALTKADLTHLKLQNKDVLKLSLHKHEPSIIYHELIPIIYQDESLVVVNKPSSIPVHPTGKYFHNSLTELLKVQLSLSQIHPCHRLDRLTSGILVFGKTNEIASKIQKQIKEKTVEKVYLARVKGNMCSKLEHSITCTAPVANLDTKIGYTNAIKEKKPALTEFIPIKYNRELDQSIVICKPMTGRTHQIRIHLKYLGHPIINDPLYGPNASKVREEFIMNESFEDRYGLTQQKFDELNEEFRSKLLTLKNGKVCEECGEEEFDEPKVEDLELWLHAYRYKFDQYEFETEKPTWCQI